MSLAWVKFQNDKIERYRGEGLKHFCVEGDWLSLTHRDNAGLIARFRIDDVASYGFIEPIPPQPKKRITKKES